MVVRSLLLDRNKRAAVVNRMKSPVFTQELSRLTPRLLCISRKLRVRNLSFMIDLLTASLIRPSDGDEDELAKSSGRDCSA